MSNLKGSVEGSSKLNREEKGGTVEFYAEMVDRDSGDIIEKWGPYDTLCKAKSMCTRKHKTGEVTMWSKFVSGEFDDDGLWPQVETNQLEGEEDDLIYPEKVIRVGNTEIPVYSQEVKQAINRAILAYGYKNLQMQIETAPKIPKIRRAKRRAERILTPLSKGVEGRRHLKMRGIR